MQNCNFSDKFVSETGLNILILSAGMDACHWFTFSSLSPGRINYSVGWALGCKIKKSSETKHYILVCDIRPVGRVRSGKGNCLWKKKGIAESGCGMVMSSRKRNETQTIIKLWEKIGDCISERPDIKVGKINVDEQPELASKFSIMSIPALVVLKNGKIVQQVSGARSKEAILAMI